MTRHNAKPKINKNVYSHKVHTKASVLLDLDLVDLDRVDLAAVSVGSSNLI